jgi:hypothetical protein
MGCVPEVLAVFHNETAGSATAFPEPYFPEGIKTVRRLRAEGRVPRQLAATLARLESLYLLQYAQDVMDCGDSATTRRVLFHECSLRYCSPLRVSKLIGRLLGMRWNRAQVGFKHSLR